MPVNDPQAMIAALEAENKVLRAEIERHKREKQALAEYRDRLKLRLRLAAYRQQRKSYE